MITSKDLDRKSYQELMDDLYGPDIFNVMDVSPITPTKTRMIRVENLEDGMIEIFEVSVNRVGYAKHPAGFELNK